MTAAVPARNLPRQVAVVTGGAGALGGATAARLAQEGATVVLTDLEADRVADQARHLTAATGAEVYGWQPDVSSDRQNRELVDRLGAEFGRLDRLVNNAAVGQEARFGEIDREEWQGVLDVDLWGPASLCQAAVPLWQAAGGGQIVNVTSRTWSGFGHLRATDGDFSLPAVAGDIEHMLDHLHTDRAVLVGHSAGAEVEALMAVRRPDLVEALVCVDPAYGLAEQARARVHDFAEQMQGGNPDRFAADVHAWLRDRP